MSDTPVKQESASVSVSLSELFPILTEVLQNEGSVTLTVTGSSMFPTLLGKRDTVTLEKAPERLAKYDLPLYRRTGGQFVLHRIVAVEEDGSYTCCGDHQWILEKGITDSQVVALATGFCRKGKKFTASTPKYRRWVRFWVWMMPARRFLFSVYSFLAKVKARIFSLFRRKDR